MTDLSTIVAAERTINIKHPATNKQLGLSITLLPDSHPKVREVSRSKLNERLQSREKPTAERMEADALDQIVAHVSGWEWLGDLNFHGEKPEFSDQSLRNVLRELPWVRTQIDEELANDAEFFRNADGSAS